MINQTLLVLCNDDVFEQASDALQEFFHHPQSHHFEHSICNGILAILVCPWIVAQLDNSVSGVYSSDIFAFVECTFLYCRLHQFISLLKYNRLCFHLFYLLLLKHPASPICSFDFVS